MNSHRFLPRTDMCLCTSVPFSLIFTFSSTWPIPAKHTGACTPAMSCLAPAPWPPRHLSLSPSSQPRPLEGPVSTLSLLPHLPAAFLPPPLVCWDHPSQVTVTSRSYSHSFFSPPAAPSGVAPLSRLIFKFIFPSPPQPLFFMPRWALSCSVRIPSSLASRCP